MLNVLSLRTQVVYLFLKGLSSRSQPCSYERQLEFEIIVEFILITSYDRLHELQHMPFEIVLWPMTLRPIANDAVLRSMALLRDFHTLVVAVVVGLTHSLVCDG